MLEKIATLRVLCQSIVMMGGGVAMRQGPLLALAWLGVVGAIGFAATIVTPQAHAQAGSCDNELPLAQSDGIYDPNVTLPTLTRTGSDPIRIPFDNRGHDAAGTMQLTAGNWIKSDRDRYGFELQFDDGYLHAGRRRISSTDEHLAGGVNLYSAQLALLCLHVKKGLPVHAGRYTGTLQIRGGPNLLASIPVELTHHDSWALAVCVALLGVILGLTVKGLSEASAGQVEGVGPWQALNVYLRELRFPLSVIVGLVAGAFIFKQVFINDPGWGGSDGIMLLFGLCFVGQLSSNEGINIVRRAVGGDR